MGSPCLFTCKQALKMVHFSRGGGLLYFLIRGYWHGDVPLDGVAFSLLD